MTKSFVARISPSTSLGSTLIPGCVLIILGCLLIAGCSDADTPTVPQSKTSDIRVTVADPVLCSQLDGLVDSQVDFFCPEVAEGGSLDRNQIHEIQDSKLIVLDATHGSLRWSQQISLPRAKIIYSTFMILEQLIPVANLATHSHGPGQPHSHAGIVSETWLDPKLFGQQIDYVLTTLKEKQLLTAEEVAGANESWTRRSESINKRLDEVATGEPTWVLVDQAGLEYLGRRLGWKIEIVVLENELKSDPSLLKRELVQWRTDHPQGRLILLNEPSEPLESLFRDLKESYLKLDISAVRFSGQQYFDQLNKILDELTTEPKSDSR